mmetsp:Transcript_45694/g.71593  ORF Transcript_45694/g.71593 Transcript_45694/m.71593 type:complete len:214 (-) Transcript_45694:345-986(-)
MHWHRPNPLRKDASIQPLWFQHFPKLVDLQTPYSLVNVKLDVVQETHVLPIDNCNCWSHAKPLRPRFFPLDSDHVVLGIHQLDPFLQVSLEQNLFPLQIPQHRILINGTQEIDGVGYPPQGLTTQGFEPEVKVVSKLLVLPLLPGERELVPNDDQHRYETTSNGQKHPGEVVGEVDYGINPITIFRVNPPRGIKIVVQNVKLGDCLLDLLLHG